MVATEGRFDADTLHKIDMINRKIDEINQRKVGIHTTWAEDELDRLELNEYISNLKLTDYQRQIVDRYNHNNDQRKAARGDWLLFMIMTACIFLEFYIGFEIYRLVTKGVLETIETLYLAFLVTFFMFNMFQMLRYLRIIR